MEQRKRGNDTFREKERLENKIIEHVDKELIRKKAEKFDNSFLAHIVFKQPVVAFQLGQYAGYW